MRPDPAVDLARQKARVARAAHHLRLALGESRSRLVRLDDEGAEHEVDLTSLAADVLASAAEVDAEGDVEAAAASSPPYR